MSAIRSLPEFAERVLEYIREHSRPNSPSSSEQDFNALALELFALQFDSVPVYQSLCRKRKLTPGRISNWQEIPALPTGAFKDFEVSSLHEENRSRVFLSSGTTGQSQSRHFHSARSLAVYEASLLPWFRACLIPEVNLTGASRFGVPSTHVGGYAGEPGLSLVVLSPSVDSAPHSSLVHMFETVRGAFRFQTAVFLGETEPDGTWNLDLALARQVLEESVRRERQLLILGTAFSFVYLLDALIEQRLRLHLPFGSRAMETGGYKGRSRAIAKLDLHTLITERLGIPSSHIISEYGMSELSSQAYDGVVAGGGLVAGGLHRDLFLFPPWARVQVISPETGLAVAEGEKGLVRVLDLANIYSVAAIQTEDLAVRRGPGFELIGRATGAEARGCSLMAP